jgi:hypothetical protein
MVRAALLVALVAAVGCAPARSKVVGRTGMVMAIGGVAGIIGSALATSYTQHADEMMLGSEAVSAVGISLYAAHELSGPEIVYRRESNEVKLTRWARILTEHAAGAARNGNCARVRKFEPRVRLYDSNYHDFVFMRDPEILRCLTPEPVEPPVPPAESIEPSEP